jgi:dCMP deaminase
MAIIVDVEGYIAGVGYNGAPPGHTHCTDGGCPRLTANSAPGSNYDNCVSVHAEINALINCASGTQKRGGTIYVNGEPCYQCAKAIVSARIKRVVYISDPLYIYSEFDRVSELLKQSDIEIINISDDFGNK